MKQMKNKIILESERLYLREMDHGDIEALCEILQDEEVMYAYEHAFSDEEVRQWLEKQLTRYKNDGFGLWAVILKATGSMIGQCGLTLQDCNGRSVVEVGYLFAKKYWHNGYATEAASACKEYAFNVLGIDEVYSIIRDNNEPSMNVAKRNGMLPKEKLVKYYYGMYMPHTAFSAVRKMPQAAKHDLLRKEN